MKCTSKNINIAVGSMIVLYLTIALAIIGGIS
jgi:hypothetical protein